MISKETFVNVMKRLESLDDNMDKADTALKKLSPDFCGLYIPEVIDIVADVLRDIFDDEDSNWIGYFMFDLDFLRDYKIDKVCDENDNPIDLSSWDKVYDFLRDIKA